MLYATTDNDLAGLKLIGREVHFCAVRQPIPIVVPDLGSTDMDLAKDQVTSEQVLHYQCRRPALAPCRVVGPPLFTAYWIAGVGPPGGPQ